MQASSVTHRFLKGFWKLRQKLFKNLGETLKSSCGIEFSHVQILRYISQQDLTPGQLSEEMYIPAHGISRALEALEDQGLLERSLNPNDSRKRTLTITKKGVNVLNKAEPIIKSEMKTILSILPEKDLEQFLNYLEALTKE